MRIVSAEAVAAATPYPALVDALSAAFAAGPEGCVAPPRAHHGVAVDGEPERTLLLMPAWDRSGLLVVKLVQVAPGNAARGLPAVQGQVMVADAETGAWVAMLDGGELTARRTAAASALAARHLARADAATLMVVGAGRLSTALIEAHATVRPIRRVLVWARRSEAAAAVAAWAQARGFAARPVGLEEGAAVADVISCATLSADPLIRGAWLRPGVHLDLVGAFRPDMRETDAAAVARAAVFVDTRAGALGEAGDLLQAAREGAFSPEAIRADLFELCSGAQQGRTDPGAITLFKSVGASLEDFATAKLALSRLDAG
ncbi:MAG: ornithine cyclodeaminase family protein [Rhodobacteraceae bacterium]|nr:MAG: ornithine cyclodeaminase family protein [Paracoccaceae bacterium]